MKFKIQNKKVFYSFIPFALAVVAPPWFVNIRAIDSKYALYWLAVLLLLGGINGCFAYSADRKRKLLSENGGQHE